MTVRLVWLLALASMIATFPELAAAAHIPQAVANYEKHLADECREVDGKPAHPKARFSVRGDLTGEGIGDWAFDEAGFDCDGAASLYGDSHGSEVTVFVGLKNGDARQAFQQLAFGMKLEKGAATATLWIVVRGPLCGQEDAPSFADEIFCDRALVWEPRVKQFDFAPLSNARIPSRIIQPMQAR